MPEQSAPDDRQQLLRFVSDASHDLVGPVDQAASLVALFVRRYRGQLDDEAQNLLTHIESAGARLAATADGLRAYFRVAEIEYNATRVNPRAALDSALIALQQEIRQSRAEINFGDLPDVAADADLLTSLFHALIQNSLKFRRAGISPQIAISAGRVQNVCRFSIADNGIGIDPQFAQEAFRAFRKLNGHAYPGAGMGLAMARTIVETLGGKIWIDSAVAPGCTVHFELPGAQ